MKATMRAGSGVGSESRGAPPTDTEPRPPPSV